LESSLMSWWAESGVLD